MVRGKLGEFLDQIDHIGVPVVEGGEPEPHQVGRPKIGHHVDLGQPSELPLRVRSTDGTTRLCGQPEVQPNQNGELLLDCVIESHPPTDPTQQPRIRPLLEAQTTEPPPSSG